MSISPIELNSSPLPEVALSVVPPYLPTGRQAQ